MDREEMHRITVREELKRICNVMAEMLSVYVRLRQKQKLNRFERKQVAGVEQFFSSLMINEKDASSFIRSDVFKKGLKSYAMARQKNVPPQEQIACYRDFLKAYSHEHRIWMKEWCN